MARNRMSVRTVMVAIAIMAAGFALFGVGTGMVVSAALLVVVVAPFSSHWQNVESAAAVAWLLGLVQSSGEVSDDELGMACVYLPCSLLLVLSWLLRGCRQLEDPAWRITQARPTSLILPALVLLGFGLLSTDMDFRLRLALSEPDLRAESLRVSRGVDPHDRRGRRVGLFRVNHVESWNRIVLWYTQTLGFFEESGLAYVPGQQVPSRSMFRFHHVHGPWWKFTVVWD